MKTSLEQLLARVAQLRNPDGGCPWDLEQTYKSLIPHILEESYETVDTIQQQDFSALKEELGDMLMQVVLLSQLAKEDGHFDFNDVVQTLDDKLVRRHPHVFGDSEAKNSEQALANWEAEKQKERLVKKQHSVLDDIPRAFPSLLRAEKLQKRCRKVGFDWDDKEEVWAKVKEEIEEVDEALLHSQTDSAHLQEEFGDLLFALVNMIRHQGFQAEELLRAGNDKFEQRFRKVEKKLAEQGRTPQESNLVEMDTLWDMVKQEEKR